jgi:hypothetical protein
MFNPTRQNRNARGQLSVSNVPDLLDDLWAKTRGKGGCWLRPINSVARYANISVDGTQLLAHRFSYERFIGPIPEGHDLHHECLVTNCVNPLHLTPILPTHHALLDPNSLGAINARKEWCPKCGGEYVLCPNGTRKCRTCQAAGKKARSKINNARARLRYATKHPLAIARGPYNV